MKRIEIISNAVDYPAEDLQRLRKVFFDRGYDVTYSQCIQLWERYSDSFSASWLILNSYSDDRIFEALKRFWIEVKE